MLKIQEKEVSIDWKWGAEVVGNVLQGKRKEREDCQTLLIDT
jgi:hypothetical protein